MSYASLVGLPDASSRPQWWVQARSELDMLDEPMAEMDTQAWRMGDEPEYENVGDNVERETYACGWTERVVYDDAVFPEDCCPSCSAARAATATWGTDEVFDHLF